MNKINEFTNMPATSVNDALGGTNYLDYEIKPLKEDWECSGPAFTVDIEAGENISVLQAIHEASPGDVLVIEGKGGTMNAFAGDFIIGLAKTKGLNGIVSNGVIRDVRDAKKLNFPVFCKGTTTAASKKEKIGNINVPIKFGDVNVNAGDIVVADADGVVIVPKSKTNEVLKKTKERIQKDLDREKAVGSNVEKVNLYLEEFLKKHL